MEHEASRVQEALEINRWLSGIYAHQASAIPRSEFVSAGHLAIAKALRSFTSGNWGGYVKTAIRNEMLTVCRRQRRRERVMRRAWSVYHAYRDHVRGDTCWP